MNILSIQGLSKSFGKHRVIDSLTIDVPEGAVFGFVGQNGAGKTTTMKMILGLLQADSGSITVCGQQVAYGKTQANRQIGYLPDVPEFYNYMKPAEYLALCGNVTGLAKQEIKNRSEELLALVGLEGVKKRIGGFSRGMKQRLGIAQALLARPKLLICDEPTSALDPVGRKEILDILLKIKESTTVLFSTHILSDVERICDHVAILNNGGIALSGTLAEIKALRRQNGLLLEFGSLADRQTFQACGLVQPLMAGAEARDEELVLRGKETAAIERTVIAALAETDLCPLRMEQLALSLENLFLEVVQ